MKWEEKMKTGRKWEGWEGIDRKFYKFYQYIGK